MPLNRYCRLSRLSLPSRPNYANAQEHIPETERNYRVIKERVRACFHNSTYRALPCIVLKYLIADCIFKLKLFPAKGGVSPYFSPHHILTQCLVDFERHCRIPVLQTVLTHDEPTPLNSLKAHAIEGTYLGPTNNVQGSHWIYNLETKAKITC